MNWNAVGQTDDLFYQRHPELVDPANGKRKPLTMDPKDRALRAEWMAMYKGADAADKAGFQACDVGGTVQACPSAAPPASPPPPVPVAAPPPPKCTVAVRALKLSPLGFYHLSILFTDSTGKEFYLRGGPGAGGVGLSASSGELSGGSSRGSSDSSSGSGSNPSASSDSSRDDDKGPYGNIATKYGEYLPHTIDYDTSAPSVTVMSGPDACGKYAELQAQMDAIAASNTRYNPLGPNSNSTVFTALKNVGITPKLPDDVWAPGKDTTIDVPAATPASP
ncbi:MAG TPA: hypothetical protein VN893_12275 [Bryobacteraceae bacterium]|nr:hypothetical protein [Bryobacteraceae bacterium]